MKTLHKWLIALVGLMFLGCLGGSFLIGVIASPYAEAWWAGRTRPLPPFGEAWVYIERQFYGELPPASVRMRGAVRGILETLEDPYTILLDPQPGEEERVRLSGRYGGVGLTLWWTPGGEIAVDPFPGGPAEEAGIEKGDRLLAVDGTEVTMVESLPTVDNLLQGDPETEVTLRLLRPPTLVFTETLVRVEAVRPSIEWRLVSEAVGYLSINVFTHETANEVSEALEALHSEGAEALILDLRGNGGGVMAPIPTIADYFLPAGVPVYTEISADTEKRVTTSKEASFEAPLVVLVDGGTASASEILAAALAQNDRAVLIGRTTFGKGSIQSLYLLQDGSVLHVTHAVWLTPAELRLDGVGLEPEVSVEPQSDRDADLNAALDFLAEKLGIPQ